MKPDYFHFWNYHCSTSEGALWNVIALTNTVLSNKTRRDLSFSDPGGKPLPILFPLHPMGVCWEILFQCLFWYIYTMVAWCSILGVTCFLTSLRSVWTPKSQPDIHQLILLGLSSFFQMTLCSNQAFLLTILCRWLANFSIHCSES